MTTVMGAVPETPAESACQVCGGPIPAGHCHILDTERCAVLCACAACAAPGPAVPGRPSRPHGHSTAGRSP